MDDRLEDMLKGKASRLVIEELGVQKFDVSITFHGKIMMKRPEDKKMSFAEFVLEELKENFNSLVEAKYRELVDKLVNSIK